MHATESPNAIMIRTAMASEINAPSNSRLNSFSFVDDMKEYSGMDELNGTTLGSCRRLVRVRPGLGGIHRALPAVHVALDLVGGQVRRETTVQLPLALQFIHVFPVSNRKPRQVGRAQRRGFAHLRPHHVH